MEARAMTSRYFPLKLLQRERDSATNQKSSLDSLMKELEDFHRTIHSESDALIPKRRKQTHSGGRGTGGMRLSRYEDSALAHGNPE